MRFRKYLLGIASLGAVIIIALVFYGQVVVYLFASANNLDISYRKLTAAGLGRFLFDGLTVSDRKSGMGLVAEKGEALFALNGAGMQGIVTDIDLAQVRFIKAAPETTQSLNNIDGMIAAPFSSMWIYDAISGRVRPAPGGLMVENLTATSKEMKMSLAGTIRDDNRISSDITIYFADTLTKKIPPEFSAVVLKNEDAGWKSISVHLEGDYVKPSLRVTGRLFRLTIGLKE